VLNVDFRSKCPVRPYLPEARLLYWVSTPKWTGVIRRSS